MMSQEGHLIDLAERWRGATADDQLAPLAKRTAEIIRNSWTGPTDVVEELLHWLEEIVAGKSPSTARVRSIYIRLEKVRSATPNHH